MLRYIVDYSVCVIVGGLIGWTLDTHQWLAALCFIFGAAAYLGMHAWENHEARKTG